MFRKHLITASIATLVATGALAQTSTPNTTTPANPAPAQTAPATPSTRAQQMTNEQLTANRIIGISIYAPNPDAPATTGSTVTLNRNAAATGTMGSTTGSTPMPSSAGTATTTAGMPHGSMAINAVSDEQWRMMRDRHDSIGKVDDLVIGNDGRVSHAVLGVGGFLGIGEKNVAIPLSDMKFMRMTDGTLVGFVTSTKQQLQDMPTFQRSRT